MKLRSTLIFPLLCMLILIAADEAPKGKLKSFAALAAIKKHDAAADKARSEYARTMGLAEKQLITELDAAEKIATKAGSLDDALAIRAAKVDAQLRLDGVQSSKPAAEKPRLAKEIVGTVWRHSLSNTTLEYHADGVLTAEGWKKPGRWEAVNENTIFQTESAQTDVQVRVTFTADRKACLWQYCDGKDHAADRVATATLVGK